MMEDENDRAKRLAKEKEAHQLHKLAKLAHSLKIDVHDLKAQEEKAKQSRQELRLGHKQKEIIWRRRGLMKYDIEKLVTVLSFQRLIRREVLTTLNLRVKVFVWSVCMCFLLLLLFLFNFLLNFI